MRLPFSTSASTIFPTHTNTIQSSQQAVVVVQNCILYCAYNTYTVVVHSACPVCLLVCHSMHQIATLDITNTHYTLPTTTHQQKCAHCKQLMQLLISLFLSLSSASSSAQFTLPPTPPLLSASLPFSFGTERERSCQQSLSFFLPTKCSISFFCANNRVH